MKVSPARKIFASVSRILVACLAVNCLNAFADFSPFDLNIIQPTAGLDSTNRYYRAYPEIEYNVQVSAVGGEYPLTYRLIDGPEGMAISSDTGVLNWTPGREQKTSATIMVTDSAGTTNSVTWTIDVTREKFLFVDSAKGSHYATGTIDDPLKSVSDIYGGTHYDAKRAGTYQDHFVYFRDGNYVLDGYRVDPRVQWTNYQPVVLMAFPGETPNLDLSKTYLWADSEISNFYLEGFNIPEMATKLVNDPDSHKGFRITGKSSHVTFRNNKFNNLALSEDSRNNQSVIMAGSSSNGGRNWAIVGNEFRNVHRAYGIVGYSVSHVLIHDNLFDNFTHGKHAIGPKKSCEHWYIRNNKLTNIQGDSMWLYWAQEAGAPFGNIEISYNYTEGHRALLINQKRDSTHLPLHVFRNTFDGLIEYRGIDSRSTNHAIHRNVIVNNTQAENGVSAGIQCTHYCSETSKIRLDEDNLVFTTSNRNSIIDSEGRVVSYKRGDEHGILGQYGWELLSSKTVEEPTPEDESTAFCPAPRVPVFF